MARGSDHARPHTYRFRAIRVLAALSLLTLVLSFTSDADAADYPLASYGDSTGTAICDVVSEINPDYADISCNDPDTASSYIGADATTATFGFVVSVDPRTTGNPGPLSSTAFVVAIAVGGTQVATVGVDGKQVGGDDFVYAKCFEDDDFTHSYLVNDGVADGRIEIFPEPSSPPYYRVQFQIPFSALTSCGVTSTTPVQLFYGTSQAANLDVINKDYFRGDEVDFTGLATIELGGSLEISKSANVVSGPTPPVVAHTTVFDLSVVAYNPSPAVMNSVVVTDVIPDGVSISTASVPVGAVAIDGQEITWDGFDLAVGESRTLVIRVSITPTSAAMGDSILLNPGADGSATRAGGGDVNASSSGVSSASVVGAAVAITKSVSPTSVNVGGTVTYTITLANTGNSATELTSVSDELPVGMSYEVGSTSGTLTAGEPEVNGQTLVWTPSAEIPAGGSRTITFDATATAAGSLSNTASVDGDNFTEDSTGPTATVTSNGPPSAVNDAASVEVNGSTNVAVLDNDTASDGDAIEIGTVTSPAHGTATANPDGTITYEPDPDYEGDDTFSYEACDADGACAVAVVSITVFAPDGPLVVLDDVSNTDEDEPAIIDVLSNDVDPEGGTLAVTTVSDPAHGTVVVNPDGTLTYSPDAGFHGTDTFTYEACVDTRCGSAEVTVTVAAAEEPPAEEPPAEEPPAEEPPAEEPPAEEPPAEEPPAAEPPVEEAEVDSPFDVLDEATVPQDGRVIMIPVNTDAGLDVGAVGDPAHGSVVLQPDGTLLYVPDAGYHGSDSFVYELCDSDGVCEEHTMRLTVLEAAPESRGGGGSGRSSLQTLPHTGSDALKMAALALLLVAAGLAASRQASLSAAKPSGSR